MPKRRMRRRNSWAAKRYCNVREFCDKPPVDRRKENPSITCYVLPAS